MFRFVDGKQHEKGFTKFIKRIVQKFLLKKGFVHRLTRSITILLLVLLLLTIVSFVANIFFPSSIARIVGIAAFAVFILAVIGVLFLNRKLKTFKKGFGINEGNEFHRWIKKIFCLLYKKQCRQRHH
ncbi:MAG: hypothetical protein C4308_05885 [Chitinophagaceae bacterium]